MAEFIGNVFEHYCPENWIPDSDNPPHEKCSICGVRHILYTGKVLATTTRAEQRREARQEAKEKDSIPGTIETYEVQVRSPRLPGEDWDGEWIQWENKKKKTNSWQSLQRVRGSMKLVSDAPEVYRIIRVQTRPAVIEKIEVIETVHAKVTEPDFVRQDFSKRNLDEQERPVYEVPKDMELD